MTTTTTEATGQHVDDAAQRAALQALVPLGTRWKRARQEQDRLRPELHAAIRTALAAHVPQVIICRLTGYTRDAIYKIGRTPDRPTLTIPGDL